MYMRQPERALERLWRALRPSGLLVCACWAEPEQVEYWSLSRKVLARYHQFPPIDPEAPGLSRFSNPERLRPLLTRSGFTLEHAESMHVPVMEAEDAAGVARWIRERGGPVAKVVEALPPEEQRAWEEELARECEPYRTGGKIQLGGVTWLFVARR
jgi:SAM-dependent methyltransferase